MKPLFTIVIPAFNRHATFDRTLKSIEAQTLRPLRVVLVDNGSRDNTLDIMHRWKEAMAGSDIEVEIATESRRGASPARNTGLDMVTTPYVMFFDSDDEMLPRHCADFADALEQNPDVDIVGRPIVNLRSNGTRRIGRFRVKAPLYNHIFHGTLATQHIVVRTEFFRSVGGWDNRSWGWDDLEAGLRLLLASPRMIALGGAPTVVAHVHPDSITGTGFSHSPAKWENTLNILEADVTAASRSDLMPWIDSRRAVLAAKYYREGARSDARRLMKKTLAATKWPWRIRMIYLQNRLTGRGSAIVARLLFPRTAVD